MSHERGDIAQDKTSTTAERVSKWPILPAPNPTAGATSSVSITHTGGGGLGINLPRTRKQVRWMSSQHRAAGRTPCTCFCLAHDDKSKYTESMGRLVRSPRCRLQSVQILDHLCKEVQHQIDDRDTAYLSRNIGQIAAMQVSFTAGLGFLSQVSFTSKPLFQGSQAGASVSPAE